MPAGRPPKVSDREFIQSCQKHGGNLSEVAKELGLKYQNAWVRAKRLKHRHNVKDVLHVPHDMEYEETK